MKVLRLIAVTWWLQLKIRSRSPFDGLLSIMYPLFYATTLFLMFKAGNADGPELLSAAIGASVIGVWGATSTPASSALQAERRQGTLEPSVATPTPFPLLVVPVTLSMASIGAYSMLATLLWGRLVFGIEIAVRQPVAFLGAAAATVVSVGMLGFLLALTTVRYRAAWALGAALELPIWLICGLLVPLSALPAWVRPVSWLLAPTWGTSAMLAATDGGNALPGIALCLGLAAVYGLIGTLLARWLVESARAHAMLALS